MIAVERIRSSLASHDAQPSGEKPARRRAAVALVLREGPAGAELLFIERARRAGDPWSGHMAFPGGRVESGDCGPRAAAERETFEEVGLRLADAHFLGFLDELRGNPVVQPELAISAFVYHAERPAALETNHEVHEAFWFPVAGLLEPARQVRYTTRAELEFPGILVGEPDRHVVWGLTYRFLETFFRVLGRPLPDRWSSDARHRGASSIES